MEKTISRKDGAMTNLKDRMIRAAKLDANLYEEVEGDADALKQAMIVVVISSVAAGFGFIQKVGFGGLVMGTVTALLGWFVWAFLTHQIGTKILAEPQTKADMGEMLRTIGFASSPGVIRVLAIIPGVSGIVLLVASVWMLTAMVIAVRQALDYKSTLRAFGVCFIGWIIQTAFIAFAFSLMNGSTAVSPVQ
jgi:hypothetical protein